MNTVRFQKSISAKDIEFINHILWIGATYEIGMPVTISRKIYHMFVLMTTTVPHSGFYFHGFCHTIFFVVKFLPNINPLLQDSRYNQAKFYETFLNSSFPMGGYKIFCDIRSLLRGGIHKLCRQDFWSPSFLRWQVYYICKLK